MPKIQCFYDDCRFLKDGMCHADVVEITPEDGCLTFVIRVEPPKVARWTDDDELDVDDEWEDFDYDEDDEDGEYEDSDYWDDEY